MTIDNDIIYIASTNSRGIYSYDLADGALRSTSFLEPQSFDPHGITFGRGKIWGVEDIGNVRVFNLDGTRSTADDFTLHEDNRDPGAATYYNGHLYVVQETGAAGYYKYYVG